MEKYWKLLNLYTNEYTTHETEEEVNHIINFICKDMQESRETIRQEIKTPFPNYDFNHVVVYDDTAIRHFIYFFDTVEEQCDDYEERVKVLQNGIYVSDKEIEEWRKRCLELKQDHRRLEALLAAEQKLKFHYIEENGDMMTAIHQYCNKCGTFTCDDCPLRHF